MAKNDNPKSPDTSAKSGSTPAPVRAPVEVGKIEIAKASIQVDTTGRSRLDVEPISLAVRDAEQNVWYEVTVENADRAAAARTMLRRAAQHWSVGLDLDPGTYEDDGRVFVRFKTREKRVVVRKPKPATDDSKEWAGPTKAAGEPDPGLPLPHAE